MLKRVLSKTKKPERGSRISFWIPDKEAWLLDEMDRCIRNFQEIHQVKMTQGDLMRKILTDYFKHGEKAKT